MYYTITTVNILVGFFAAICVFNVARNYSTVKRVEVYWLLTMAAMIFLVCVNVFNLTEPAREWKIAILSLLWASKTIYYSWAIRFSAMKKDKKNKK